MEEKIKKSTKTQITKSEYHCLIGLREVAKRQWLILEELEKAATKITGEKDKYGHASDYLGGSRELDDMLRILKIEVEK